MGFFSNIVSRVRGRAMGAKACAGYMPTRKAEYTSQRPLARSNRYVDPSEAMVLAKTLYGEARGESREGRIAVAWTILNRTRIDLWRDGRPDWWGETVFEVCTKPWQYSCWNTGDPNRKLLESLTVDGDPEHPAFRQCLSVAYDVLSGELADPTKGATHYHSVYVTPDWARGHASCHIEGGHIFYNDVEPGAGARED